VAASCGGGGVTLPGSGGGSCGGDVKLPSAAGGVTAADCEAGSATAGSRGGGGSWGGAMTLPSAAGEANAADCKAGSAAAGSRGSDATAPGPFVSGKPTDGPAAANTPSAGGAFQIAVYFLTCSSKVRSRRPPNAGQSAQTASQPDRPSQSIQPHHLGLEKP
jgi:hypothetical protein